MLTGSMQRSIGEYYLFEAPNVVHVTLRHNRWKGAAVYGGACLIGCSLAAWAIWNDVRLRPRDVWWTAPIFILAGVGLGALIGRCSERVSIRLEGRTLRLSNNLGALLETPADEVESLSVVHHPGGENSWPHDGPVFFLKNGTRFDLFVTAGGAPNRHVSEALIAALNVYLWNRGSLDEVPALLQRARNHAILKMCIFLGVAGVVALLCRRFM
jgi:hypothetical protein